MSEKIFVRKAVETSEGSGVDVKRLFPVASWMNFDPFVLWDHFNVVPGTGFPDHPHRGFEGITYMFSGSMEHTDNLGNRSRVEAGGAQRFTAGSGIVHSEMPGTEGRNEGIQMWVNLPRRLKSIDPEYQQVNNDEFPVLQFEKGSVRTIVGEGSPLLIKTPFIYRKLDLEAGGEYSESLVDGFRGFVYVVSGKPDINGQNLTEGDACFIEQAEQIRLHASTDCTVMICLGKPHGEPIRQHGPFVD